MTRMIQSSSTPASPPAGRPAHRLQSGPSRACLAALRPGSPRSSGAPCLGCVARRNMPQRAVP